MYKELSNFLIGWHSSDNKPLLYAENGYFHIEALFCPLWGGGGHPTLSPPPTDANWNRPSSEVLNVDNVSDAFKYLSMNTKEHHTVMPRNLKRKRRNKTI